jgi:hypothetical protein
MDQDSESQMPIGAVAKRFAESAEALGELHEQLLNLARTEEQTTTTAREISELAVAAKEFVVSAAALIDETRSAQALVSEALGAATAFLDSANLDDLGDAVDEIAESVDARLLAIESMLGEMRVRDARIAELEEELARRTARLPGRAKRQLGLAE